MIRLSENNSAWDWESISEKLKEIIEEAEDEDGRTFPKKWAEFAKTNGDYSKLLTKKKTY